MKSNKSVLTSALFATTVLSCCVSVHSAPLPFGTTFTLDPGANPDATGLCTTGSCWGYEVSPNLWIWTMIAPGNDGGFIAGKDQLSGGQELAPSGTNYTPGDITAAWMFWSYGTFYADNALNVFSDTSNDGTTVLNDFNMAWNGSINPLGGGAFLDYTITQNGIDPEYSFEYRTTVTTGQFAGVNFRLIARGNILPVPATNLPVVNDVSISAESSVITNWVPDFTDADFADTHSCAIAANASNGNATVDTDCTGGTYQSGDAYEGMDSFSYKVTDASGLSDTGVVMVLVEPPTPEILCMLEFPLKQVTTVGGGQSPAVNASLQTAFTGHIITESGLITGGKNAVRICPGTIVDFITTSTVGTSTCQVNGAVSASTGSVTVGDKLICRNNPDGSDVDRFTVKSGN